MDGNAVQNEVIERLSCYLKEGTRATLETKILADTTMDSVNVMDFVLELEDALDITIPLNRLADVETVGDLILAIEKIQKTTS